MQRLPATDRSSQRGVTLIELLVAMLLSLILAIAVLWVERSLGQQKSRGTDTALRDNEIRAAMDVITHDVTSAGFLMSDGSSQCDALMTYNSSISGYYTHHQVDGLAALTGTVMPFGAGFTLNYPTAASGIPSSVLVLTGANSSFGFDDAISPLVLVAPNGAYDPMAAPQLPVTNGGIGLTAGDIGMVAVPLNGFHVCMRVPIVSITAGVGTSVVNSSGNLIPAASYGGFSLQLPATGLGTSLSDAAIFQGSIVDLGPPAPIAPATTTQVTTAYYIDGSGAYPVLMRAIYSLRNDSLVAGPQAIAAGVVSLQVLFGVDPGNTGSVTAYETGPTVLANAHYDAILSVRIALVTRALYADPNSAFTNPAATIVVGNGFTSVPIPLAYMNYRYNVQQTEVSLRNCRWTLGC